MAEDQEDRTEAATPRRLQQAREEGNVPLSHEAPALAGLGAATLVMMMLAPSSAQNVARMLRGLIDHAGELSMATDLHAVLLLALKALAFGAAPIILAVVAAGVGVSLLQSGIALRPSALMPDLGRLSPMQGIRRLFGAEHLVDVLKSLVKAGILGFGLWRVLLGERPVLGPMLSGDPTMLLDRAMRAVLHVLLFLLIGQSLLTIGDILWVRLRHAGKLRMSREEVKQDMKETDGNPEIKARLRRLRMTRARRRMMAAVPKAAVVVTNPTHYAVALHYERGRSAAPRVVAKGVDEVAAKIREIAEANRVPIVPSPPLARALYLVELDAEIPGEHFQAVAEIIAFVWRLRGRNAARPPVM